MSIFVLSISAEASFVDSGFVVWLHDLVKVPIFQEGHKNW